MYDRIIGQYLFENTKGFALTVNEDIYRYILNAFYRRIGIHLRNRHRLWFQQDGATYHTANEPWMCFRECLAIISSPAELLSRWSLILIYVLENDSQIDMHLNFEICCVLQVS